MLDIAFAKPAMPKSGALVLLVHEGEAPSGLWETADEATGGAIARALAAAEFKGGKGKTCLILAPGAGLTRVLAVGLGKADAVSETILEEAGGAIVAALARETAVAVATGSLAAPQVARVGMGAALRSYRFDRYRTKEKPEDKPKLAKLTLLTADGTKAKAAWEPLKAVANGVFLTRDLVSEPPNVLTPAEMAERCKTLTSLGLKVDVLGPKEMAKLGFGALLGVAQGSVNEPRMVVMQWNGAGAAGRRGRDKPVAFIGKGVTFDTGGISIKPAANMDDMKMDMGGAAAVFGAMQAVGALKLPLHVVGIVCSAENMPSSTAYKPGDIIKTLSGKTVEVLNTDAEGRIVLADGLFYAQRYNPAAIVDLATLTGAIMVALGPHAIGMMGTSQELADRLKAAGEVSAERVWQLPLWDEYRDMMKSEIADLKNTGGRFGGAITAGGFLAAFVGDHPWVHLDIAGTAWVERATRPYYARGATGIGVRLLVELLRGYVS